MPTRRPDVELRLSLFGVKRSISLSGLARYRNTWVVLAASLLVIPLTLWLLAPAAVPDLAHGNVSGARALVAGWAKVDIYNSPMLRTVQTAGYMFNHAASEDWLISCKGRILQEALAHKIPGRNLILVTHSECMAELEKDLDVPVSDPGYGSSLFVSAANKAAPRMLGFIEASDWHSVTTR
jgi:hypothetical protein